jgi:hypothetical protein
MEKWRKFFSQYWPLLAILPMAGVLDLGLLGLGEPWSASEWASNIIFAYAVTLATVALTRRQEKLQESLAASELFDKIASVSGALDTLRVGSQASSVCRILIDARAGLQLVPYADRISRHEYMTSLRRAVGEILNLINGSVRPYTLWSDLDWEHISECADRLFSSLKFQISRPGADEMKYRQLMNLLEQIRDSRPLDGKVPFTSFEKSFRRGDVSQRIRVRLDWDRLISYIEDGAATIRTHRHWSADWLKQNRIFSVWYTRTDTGLFAEYLDQNILPISHEKINEYLEILPMDIRSGIESMADYLKLRPDGVLPTVEIVTFEISDHNLLVLDGNHRVAAIAKGQNGSTYPLLVNIVEYRISAPVDPELLPDLIHHQGEVQTIQQ